MVEGLFKEMSMEDVGAYIGTKAPDIYKQVKTILDHNQSVVSAESSSSLVL